ncbi:MAG TPA: type II toxin-antitoxin system VapC family toxin [Candidatus Competibacter sp.]|nr:VapC toxin family PIN domain ribonuclease [Candidatus Competibacteraceae bacterium]HRE54120.1 type II toxin-antitoxin system VapC family toxin [Candidatus Competibacter sp.]
MIGLDTNILARYLLNDDPVQAEAAETLLSSGERYFVPVTVWLELVWVLECYDCSREEIAKALRHLLGLPDLEAGESLALLQALQWFEAGADFADALHLALSSSAQAFATFDRALIKRARRTGIRPSVVNAERA